MFKKSFDSVEFQRKVRENALKEANYDIRKLIEQVNDRLKNNELNIYFESLNSKDLKTA